MTKTQLANPPQTYDSAAVTHLGRIRKFNEDSIYANDEAGIWLVADGMGGHKDGNVASAMIASAAKLSAESSAGNHLFGVLVEQLQIVNGRLLDFSDGENHNIVGSTVALLTIRDDRYTCVWAGDSRCYLIRDGVLAQVSHDHTEVQDLLDKGLITPAEAKTWPRRNVITRAVGANRDLELDQASGPTAAGDCFVLCSDGLTGHVTDGEILATVSWSSANDACNALVNLALDRGGKDNVSVIIVNVVRRDANLVRGSW